MSINKLISIRNPILNAMDMAAVDHDSLMPLFTQWATEAEKEIGGYYQFTRQWALLDVKGCVAELPCNAVKVEGSIIGDVMDNCCSIFNSVFGQTIGFVNPNIQDTTGFLIVDNGGGDSNWTGGKSSVPFHIQNNKIIFNCQPSFKNLTIQYIGYSVDCDGFMEIGENHVDAITSYILYKWMLRKRKKTGADFNEMQWHYKEWDRLCAHSRALDAYLSDSDKEEIARLYHDPLAGRGLYLGMTNPNNYGYGGTGSY